MNGALMAKEKAWMQMYDDYTEEKIERDTFLSFKKAYDREVEELKGQLALLKEKQATEALRREAGDTEKYREVLAATELTNEIMESFVDAVDVFADGRLEMHLKIDEDV